MRPALQFALMCLFVVADLKAQMSSPTETARGWQPFVQVALDGGDSPRRWRSDTAYSSAGLALRVGADRALGRRAAARIAAFGTTTGGLSGVCLTSDPPQCFFPSQVANATATAIYRLGVLEVEGGLGWGGIRPRGSDNIRPWIASGPITHLSASLRTPVFHRVRIAVGLRELRWVTEQPMRVHWGGSIGLTFGVR